MLCRLARRSDTGAGAAEYAGLVVLAALILGALVAAGVPQKVTPRVSAAICEILHGGAATCGTQQGGDGTGTPTAGRTGGPDGTGDNGDGTDNGDGADSGDTGGEDGEPDLGDLQDQADQAQSDLDAIGD